MKVKGLNVDPRIRYEGPDFEEYCIREGEYLPASRDRSPCTTCCLSPLCQTGFEEQVRRVVAGENPSLTEGVEFDEEAMSYGRLTENLTEEQRAFVSRYLRF